MIVWYTFAVIQCFVSGKHSETILSLQRQSQTVQYMIVKISLIISHNAEYALTLVYIYIYKIAKQGLILSSHVNKSYIFISNRSCSYDLIIIWSLLSWETRTKRNIKRVLAGCQMLWEVGSEVLLPTAAAWQIQSLLSISCALYEGVLLLLSSCPSEHFMTVPWL